MTRKQLLSQKFLILMSMSIFTLSCISEEINIEDSSENLQTQTSEVLLNLKDLGHNIDNVIELEDYYVLEGDLVFPKNIKDYKSNELNNVRHYHSNTFVSDANFPIKVFSNLPQPSGIPTGTNWEAAVDDAISDWNSFNTCRDLFVRVTSQNVADISITTENPWPIGASHVFGWVNGSPSCGNPFDEVLINTNFMYDNNTPPTQNNMRNIIGHELGHAIGFKHTDGLTGTPISQTPFPDPESIMHQNIVDRTLTGLTTDDVVAANYLYGCSSTVNDNQSNVAVTNIVNINPHGFCYTDDFNVVGTFNACSTNTATIELYIKEIGVFSAPTCIASGTFNNGNFNFQNLNLTNLNICGTSSTFNFDNASSYELRAKISNDAPSLSDPFDIPFEDDCDDVCTNPCDFETPVEFQHLGGGVYSYSVTQDVLDSPCEDDYNYYWWFKSGDNFIGQNNSNVSSGTFDFSGVSDPKICLRISYTGDPLCGWRQCFNVN